MKKRTSVIKVIMKEEDKKTSWYKNCKRQRKVGAKICQVCPLRKVIELWEDQ